MMPKNSLVLQRMLMVAFYNHISTMCKTCCFFIYVSDAYYTLHIFFVLCICVVLKVNIIFLDLFLNPTMNKMSSHS